MGQKDSKVLIQGVDNRGGPGGTLWMCPNDFWVELPDSTFRKRYLSPRVVCRMVFERSRALNPDSALLVWWEIGNQIRRGWFIGNEHNKFIQKAKIGSIKIQRRGADVYGWLGGPNLSFNSPLARSSLRSSPLSRILNRADLHACISNPFEHALGKQPPI